MRPESVRVARRFWGALAGAVPKKRKLLRALPSPPSLSHAGRWSQLPRTKQLRDQQVGGELVSQFWLLHPCPGEEVLARAAPLLGRVPLNSLGDGLSQILHYLANAKELQTSSRHGVFAFTVPSSCSDITPSMAPSLSIPKPSWGTLCI